MDHCIAIMQGSLSESAWSAYVIVYHLIHCCSRKILKDATTFFSCGTPNLATVIPAMDFIDTRLTNYARDRSLAPSIRAAVGIGKQTLNRYYELTDASEVYRIAMSEYFVFIHFFFALTSFSLLVLHPRHKLSYFATAGWQQDWINTAENLLRAEFDRSYRQDVLTDDDEGLDAGSTTGARVRSNFITSFGLTDIFYANEGSECI